MRSKWAFFSLILVVSAVVASRAQQAPTTNSNTSSTTAQQSRPTTATISGTIADAKTGQPLRKASVSLRQTSGNGRGNNNNGGNGGRGGGNGQRGPGGTDPLAQNSPQGNNLPGGALPGGALPGGAAGGTPSNQNQNQNQTGLAALAAQVAGRGNNDVTTGDDGTYSFTNVNPGQYQVVVSRDGFINQEYGQRSWVSGTGATLTVTAGQQLTGINVAMVQAGTIAGKIRDETGEPMTGIQVQALSYQYQNGSKSLVSARQVQTDDLGNYRLYWLTPGEYYISAIPNGPGGRRGQQGQALAGLVQAAGLTQVASAITAAVATPAVEEAYAPTYYPGGYEPENAIAVPLPAAQELGGMDFVLRPIQMVTVSGKVTAVDVSTLPLTPAQQQAQQRQQQQQAQQGNRGGRGGNNNNNNNNNGGRGGRGGNNQAAVNVILTRIGPASNGGGRGGRGGGGGGGNGGGRGGPGGPGGFGGFGNGGQSRAIVGQDGTFIVDNVIPGSYNLTAIQQAAGQTFTARTRVEVGFANVDNINLAVSAGVDIKGQVAAEDGKSPTNFKLNNVRLTLTPTEDVPIGNVQAQPDADGNFTLTGVPAMSYKLSFSGVTGGYVVSGRLGNNDALNEPMQVDQGQAGTTLAVKVGFQPGTVGGDVADAKAQPFQAATCVLVPNDRNRLDLYKTASSDQNGKFNLTNVAPGEYKLFAWESIPSGAYTDAAYLRPFEDKGKPITVGKGASISVPQLSVILAMQ